MNNPLDSPLLIFAASFVLLWLATYVGAKLLRNGRVLNQETIADFSIVLGTTLTLSGLIVGFTFSMAIGRYEQRKNYEEAEANAIGTQYLRAQLLSAGDAAKMRSLLKGYADERVSYYEARDALQLKRIEIRTSRLRDELWAEVLGAATTDGPAIASLVIAGMNDVLNSQGYTEASWWNRIPTSAWILMVSIAVLSHLLVGYGAQSAQSRSPLRTVLPLVVSIAFLLIADIDSPRSGIIRVQPRNLIMLVESMNAP
jgi:hypothetical protein